MESLPFADGRFDTVVNTMSFSGYPDGARAMSELCRVARPGGRLVLIDVNYPGDGNRLGTALVSMWKRSGDLIRDMDRLLGEFGFRVCEREIGGWGSIHLYSQPSRMSVLAPDRVARTYDRIGRFQDWQSFYERPATERLIAHAAFEEANRSSSSVAAPEPLQPPCSSDTCQPTAAISASTSVRSRVSHSERVGA